MPRVSAIGATAPNDARILNFRILRIAVARQAAEVVPVGSGYKVGTGWYPLETFNGESFRWVNNDAMLEAGAAAILLEAVPPEVSATVVEAVSIPVIASGGAGSARDFIEVFRDGRADAALAASIFHFGIENIAKLKRKLLDASIPVRWPC